MGKESSFSEEEIQDISRLFHMVCRRWGVDPSIYENIYAFKDAQPLVWYLFMQGVKRRHPSHELRNMLVLLDKLDRAGS